MSKDYAKIKTKLYPKPPSRNVKKSKTEKRLWILVSVLLALFVFGLMVLKHESTKNPAPSAVVEKKPSIKKPKELPQPRFDFYTMLPNGDPATGATEKPAQDGSAAALPEKTATGATTSSPAARDEIAELAKKQLEEVSEVSASVGETYVLQFALFKKYTAADGLKAQLAMQGISVEIKKLVKDGGILYRVWLGPYSSRGIAQQKRKELQEELQVKSIIIKES